MSLTKKTLLLKLVLLPSTYLLNGSLFSQCTRLERVPLILAAGTGLSRRVYEARYTLWKVESYQTQLT